MTEVRTKEGLIVTALGAAALAGSVFLPWYHLTLTDSGVAAAQQGVDQAVQPLNDPTLQGLAGNLKASFSGLAGRTLGTASAHQSLKIISVVLLGLAAICLVATLLRLADAAPGIAGSHLAAVGGTAAVFVVYRMAVPPHVQGDYISLSVGWGAWAALAACAAMVIGALLPAGARVGSWLGVSDTH